MMKLYCSALKDTFTFTEHDIFPARCVGCDHQICLSVMRERVRENIDKTQLEFDFGKEVTNE